MKKPKLKFVIDTDVGTDCDDAFALAYAMQAMKDGKTNITAITTVQGDTQIRAKIARKLERMLGIDIPIIVGESCSDEVVRKYWSGIEEQSLTEEEKAEPLKKYAWPIYDPQTRLVCIGPLTNIAMQLEKNPSIKNVKSIYVMGSSPTSHNFKVDPKATRKVFEQPWQIFQITKEDSLKIGFSREELEAFRKNRLGEFLYRSTMPWFDYAQRNIAVMYDALVISAALEEDFVKFYSWANIHTSFDVSPKLKQRLMEIVENA